MGNKAHAAIKMKIKNTYHTKIWLTNGTIESGETIEISNEDGIEILSLRPNDIIEIETKESIPSPNKPKRIRITDGTLNKTVLETKIPKGWRKGYSRKK